MLTEGRNFGITESRNFGHAESSIPSKTPFCRGYNDGEYYYIILANVTNKNGAVKCLHLKTQ